MYEVAAYHELWQCVSRDLFFDWSTRSNWDICGAVLYGERRARDWLNLLFVRLRMHILDTGEVFLYYELPLDARQDHIFGKPCRSKQGNDAVFLYGGYSSCDESSRPFDPSCTGSSDTKTGVLSRGRFWRVESDLLFDRRNMNKRHKGKVVPVDERQGRVWSNELAEWC